RHRRPCGLCSSSLASLTPPPSTLVPQPCPAWSEHFSGYEGTQRRARKPGEPGSGPSPAAVDSCLSSDRPAPAGLNPVGSCLSGCRPAPAGLNLDPLRHMFFIRKKSAGHISETKLSYCLSNSKGQLHGTGNSSKPA